MRVWRPPTAGFTLVEVLVALLLVALGAAAVLSALSTGARAHLRLEQRMYAEWVALNILTETRLASEPPSVGERSGDVLYANRNWRWHETVSTTSVPEVLQIDIRVSLMGESPLAAERELARVTGARLALPAGLTTPDVAWDPLPLPGSP